MTHVRYSKHITRGERWRTLRMAVLERDGFQCRVCGARGRLDVDHIRPVRTHPQLAHDPANLQALCVRHHVEKTRIECGHAPLPEPRKKWRDAVLTLARKGQ